MSYDKKYFFKSNTIKINDYVALDDDVGECFRHTITMRLVVTG